jgi:hypothetical protein
MRAAADAMSQMRYRALLVAASFVPAFALAQSSANYAASMQEGAAAGAASSTRYRVEALAGSTFASANASSATYAVKTGVRPDARFDRSAFSLASFPIQPLVGQPLVLRAMVASGGALAGNVAFSDNGATLAGCDAVAVQVLAGNVAGAGVATCSVTSATAGAHHYVASFAHVAEGGPAQAALDATATASVATDYTDLWWGGAAQNGWGVAITQHGGMQFNVLYTYDANGKPLWYAMPGGTWDASHTTFSGALYVPSSAPYDEYVASRKQVGAAVGNASIKFTSASTAQLTYTIGGVSGSKGIERQPFGSDDGAARLQVNDLWWGGEMQDGWGVSIAQQRRVLFMNWFSYDANGRDTWFVVPGGTWNGTSFTGDLYATTSSAWLGADYAPAAFATVKVGSMTLDFADQAWATMTWTLKGETQSKTIVRQPY